MDQNFVERARAGIPDSSAGTSPALVMADCAVDDPLDIVHANLRATADLLRSVADFCDTAIVEAAEQISQAFRRGNKLLLCGNGGSAADCQHLAAEFVGRLSKVPYRAPLPAIALTTDTSLLTALTNDFGFETVFSRQVQALGRPGDVLVAISTSGDSANVLAAAIQASSMQLVTVGLTGNSGRLRQFVDIAICVPDCNTQRIQESHLAIEHLLCLLTETVMQKAAGGGSVRPAISGENLCCVEDTPMTASQ